MNNPEPDPHIQALPKIGKPSNPLGAISDSPPAAEPIPQREQGQRTRWAGTLFGALVGLPMGALVGAACCWLTGLFDEFVRGMLIGAATGPFAGAFIGGKERKAHGDLVRPDIATIIGFVFGLLPALIVALQGAGAVRGNFSGYVLIGMAFIGPTIGVVIGAILDRAFEASLTRSWGAALAFAVAGLAVCIGAVCVIDALAYGPDPQEIAREVRAQIITRWREKPETRDSTIQQVTLVRTGRRTYSGFVDATLAGMPGRLTLEVAVDNETISMDLQPLNE